MHVIIIFIASQLIVNLRQCYCMGFMWGVGLPFYTHLYLLTNSYIVIVLYPFRSMRISQLPRLQTASKA